MELHEKINRLLQEKKISKKEFAKQLAERGVHLKNSLEAPSVSTVYAYLSGRIGIKAELIPYIADILGVSEQFLFDDSKEARYKLLRQILEDLSEEERMLIENTLRKTSLKSDQKFQRICSLLRYAPEEFLHNLEASLNEFRHVFLKFGFN